MLNLEDYLTRCILKGRDGYDAVYGDENFRKEGLITFYDPVWQHCVWASREYAPVMMDLPVLGGLSAN